jgi:hypothetical protein
MQKWNLLAETLRFGRMELMASQLKREHKEELKAELTRVAHME